MWPSDQNGGGFDPQQPNPYKQPTQPAQPGNPYQQPGYGYPQQGQGQQQGQPGPQGPYGHTAPPNPYPYPYGYPQEPPTSPPGGGKSGGGSSRKAVIAAVTSVAVIAAAVVTGVVLLGDEERNKQPQAGGGHSGVPSASASASPSSPTATPSSSGADAGDPQPVIPGWQTVTNPKHYSAFDVPKGEEWTVEGSGYITGFADDETGDVLVGMSAPAFYKDGWCEDSWRAAVGTKGAQGAKGTKDAAKTAAINWVLSGYDQKQKGKLKESGAKPFSNSHGIKGHIATATVTDVPTNDKCAADAGKVVAVSWLNVNNDLSLWVLVTDAGVDAELSQSMIDKMAGSLRDFGEPGLDTNPRD